MYEALENRGTAGTDQPAAKNRSPAVIYIWVMFDEKLIALHSTNNRPNSFIINKIF